MAIYALTGNDSFILNDRVFNDMADGSTVTISFPNEKIGHTTGKNGNTIFATDKQGLNAEVELRLIAGSSDDIWLNGINVEEERDLPTFTTLNGSFSKRIGDGNGKVKFINYVLLGGVIRQNIDANENLQGETEQGIAVYRLFFAQAARTIG
ncbi:MAG: hypothetical protein II244_01065 [Clostridia bacterium]|nr:hypothetical protein [Clostridia bacterium]